MVSVHALCQRIAETSPVWFEEFTLLDDSVGTKPKRHYFLAVSIGTAVGLFGALVFAIFRIDSSFPEIPHWDWGDIGPESLRPGKSLDLQFHAVLLRMCMVMLNHGFAFLAVPIALAVLLERHSETNFVRSVYQSLAITSLAYLCVWLFFVVKGISSPPKYEQVDSLLEMVYGSLYLFIFGLALFTYNWWLPGFFLSCFLVVQPWMWEEIRLKSRAKVSFDEVKGKE